MNPRKKILFVITKSNWGGAQRYVFDLATSLPKEEFNVAVVFGGTGTKNAEAGTLEKRLAQAGIRTIFVKSFMRDVSAGKDVSALGELTSIFRKECPDVVHLNSSKAGGIGALAARIAKVPKIIFTVHGLPWDESRNFFSRTLIYLATRLTFLLCHTVITISRDNYNRARACWLCRRKIVLIYNGIAPMAFGSGEKIRNAFPAGAHITGTIGELNKNKNQQALIEQAKNNPDMYIAIVGEGEERSHLQELIRKNNLENRVKLFGFISAAEALKGFDEFALPSIKEGLPYVLLEAKQAGLPIIANRVGGVGEILDNTNQDEFTLQNMVEKTTDLYLSAS